MLFAGLALAMAQDIPDCATAAVVASSRGSGGRWTTNEVYPPAALRAGVQGDVGFELDIDACGKPTTCRIVKSSGSDVLDAATCPLMLQRARFNPATDEAGRPIPAVWRNVMKWRLPAD